MPFAKDNQLWKRSHEARKKNKDRMAEFLSLIANGAIPAYGDALAKMYNGEELPKPVIEAMERTEKWKDFIAPKKAAVDDKGETVRPVLVMPSELMEKNGIKQSE